MIISGVVFKNSMEQVKMLNMTNKIIGMTLFIGGWLYMAFALSNKCSTTNASILIFSSLLILIAAIAMKNQSLL